VKLNSYDLTKIRKKTKQKYILLISYKRDIINESHLKVVHLLSYPTIQQKTTRPFINKRTILWNKLSRDEIVHLSRDRTEAN